MDDSDSRTAGRATPSRSAILAVALLLLVGVGLPVLIGMLSGAISVPRNDDPAYRRVALELYSTGQLRFNAWSEMTLVGQIVYVQPFLWLSGGGAWAFAASTAVLAVAGIVAGFALARRVLSVPRATLAVLAVLVFPGFVLNTTSYMTDVPAWSTEVVCLWLGVVALSREGRRRWLWLTASLAVGCFAFSIREFALAAPAAVIAAHVAVAFRRPGNWMSAAAVLIVCGGVYLLKEQVPGARAVNGPDLTSVSTGGLKEGIATLALAAAPALILTVRSWWRHWRAIDVLIGLAVGLAVYRTPLFEVLRTHAVPRLLLTNMLEPSGSLGLVPLAGSRPVLFVEPVWSALNDAAFVAAFALFGVAGGAAGRVVRSQLPRWRDGAARLDAWHRVGSVRGLLALFAILYAGGLTAWSFFFPTYDRYLWPLIIPLYVLILMPAGDPKGAVATEPKTAPALTGQTLRSLRVGAAAVSLAVLAAVSTTLLLNADAFDTARWRMGETAVADGATATTVDAGFEWVTFYATGLAVHAPPPGLGAAYETRWPSFHLCTLVSSSPLSDPALTLQYTNPDAYRLFLFAGPTEPLYTYRVRAQGCP